MRKTIRVMLSIVLFLCLAVVLLIIYKQNKPSLFEWPKREELETMSDGKLLSELMDYGVTYAPGCFSAPYGMDEAPKVNAFLRELLSRSGGAERLVNFYQHWIWLWPERKDELAALFQTQGFLEAVGQEEYERLFPQ